MLLFNLISSPLVFIIFITAIFMALSIHEFAHAWAAVRLGDDTPKLTGRLTLNPLAHLDAMGFLFLLLAGFGWGKPVLVNPRHFKNPVWDNLTVALSGPMSNFLLALILGLMVRFVSLPAMVQTILFVLIFFNLVFMAFNLLPVPPLDGSKVLRLFMSERSFLMFEQMGILILFGLLIFSSFVPVIPFYISRVVNFFFSLITGQPAIF